MHLSLAGGCPCQAFQSFLLSYPILRELNRCLPHDAGQLVKEDVLCKRLNRRINHYSPVETDEKNFAQAGTLDKLQPVAVALKT